LVMKADTDDGDGDDGRDRQRDAWCCSWAEPPPATRASAVGSCRSHRGRG
jgi:hypothetical protein